MIAIRQNKFLKTALGITLLVMFLIAACMHLLCSPHHQNLTGGFNTADFPTQPFHNVSLVNVKNKESIGAFPVDFEMPEVKFGLTAQVVMPLLDILGQFEFLAKKHFLSHSRSARSPPI